MGSIGKILTGAKEAVQRIDTVPTKDVQAVVDYANANYHPTNELTPVDWRAMEAAQTSYFLGRVVNQATPKK